MTQTRIDGEFPQPEHALMPPEPVYKRWQCFFCGYIYDEALGWPEDGIAPGTSWADVPDDWICPDCGVDKSHFEMIEIG